MIVGFIAAFISCEENEPLPVAVTDVILNVSSLELTEGEDFVLIATVNPENAANKKVTWSSSDDAVASVNDGKITAVKAGTATITVTTEDGGKTAACEVTVRAKVYPVESVSLDKTSLELTEGDEATLTATVAPENATNKNVTWASSDAAVATVDEGKVTAVKAGTATITVTTEDGGKTAACSVTVSAKQEDPGEPEDPKDPDDPEVVPVSGVTLVKTVMELTEGDEATLTATVAPENATNKNVSWSSSDASVATVNDGKVTAVKAGTATITVTTEDGGKTAACEVTVRAKVYPVESVSLDKTSLELTEGDEATLTATVAPENATNKNVTWASSDAAVATVDEGKVTAVKAGTATITVTTEDGGKTAACSVTVSAKQEDPGEPEDPKDPDDPEVVPVSGVTLVKTVMELTEGDEATLTATVAPENATNKNVTWTSSDAAVATVEEGKVTAVKAGTATITVTTEDGGKTATCGVTVKAKVYPVESVTLDKTTLELTEGDEATLTATIAPENATDKNVSWTSSDAAVATVKDGKVTAIKAGTATITVTTEDGGKTAACSVTVAAKQEEPEDPEEPEGVSVEAVTLDITSLALAVGDEFTLVATVTPDNATNKAVTWSSSDNTVVTVNDGNLKAIKAGVAVIIVSTEDGGKVATCTVNVSDEPIPLTGLSLDKTSVVLNIGEEINLVVTISPDEAKYRKVNWSTSDTSVATVEDGKVKAIKAGFATIKAAIDDSWWVNCYVQVINPGGNEGIGYDEYN